MAAAENLGAEQVRLEPPGVGDSDGRFRRHSHITGLVAGKRFRFPVPFRLKDTPRRWLNYFTNLRRLLVALGASHPKGASASLDASHRRRKRRPRKHPRSPFNPVVVPEEPGPLDLVRWAPLVEPANKHTSQNQQACSCSYCAPLRELRQRLTADKQHHPIYAARGNEQPLLQDLVEADPPAGGVAAYVADLDREKGSV
jgi:hypothetical protein